VLLVVVALASLFWEERRYYDYITPIGNSFSHKCCDQCAALEVAIVQ